MRTVLLYMFASVIIVLNFDWNWKPKREFGCATVEEPAGICGNVYTSSRDQPPVFKTKCATCHSLEKDGTGPALEGMVKNIPGGAKFFEAFVKNEDSLVKSWNKDAIRIVQSRAATGDHNYKDISPEDWAELVNYLR